MSSEATKIDVCAVAEKSWAFFFDQVAMRYLHCFEVLSKKLCLENNHVSELPTFFGKTDKLFKKQ